MTRARDVVVVGAGLAGLEVARRLASRGLDVVLADRRRDLGRSVRTTGIFVRRTVEEFPLPADTLGPALRRVTLWSPRRRPLRLESRRNEFWIGRMAPLYRRRLDECTREGVEWRPGAVYLGSEPEGCESVVRLSGSAPLRARFLVGADGARSEVAVDLGLDTNREWLVGVEDVFECAPLDDLPGLHCFLDPTVAPGYIAWLAWDGGEAHVGTAGYPGRFEPTAALEAFLASRPAGLDAARARRRERRGGRIPVGGVLKRIVCPRGLLVGDAAGAVSPLTAGGLDPCLRLSRLAGEVTARHLAGDTSALGDYAGHRFRARFTSRLLMRRAIAAVRAPWLAEAACAGLRSWPFAALARHVFFGEGSFPDSEPRATCVTEARSQLG
ncbi:MAG: NAD(P)/FAD-dependent oxidoreductase [Acidobacteriota bacterium]